MACLAVFELYQVAKLSLGHNKAQSQCNSKNHQAVPGQAVTLRAGNGMKSLRASGTHAGTTQYGPCTVNRMSVSR